MYFSLPTIDGQKIIDQFLFNPKEPLLFNTGFFVWLFTAFMLGYALVHRQFFWRTLYLTLFSVYFYYKSSGPFVINKQPVFFNILGVDIYVQVFWLLILSTLVDYLLGFIIDKREKKPYRLAWLWVSIVFNLGVLCLFKYLGFFSQISADLFGQGFNVINLVLPVGISFFTFQKLSYTIDIYRRKLKPTKSFLDFSFFVTFFPHLVAGPIVRAADFLPQIRQAAFITKEDLGRATMLIASGLLKKAVISDYISVNFVDRVFDDPTLYSGFENLMAVYGYTLQIFCDFSGYSDMAIGIAQLLGYKLADNFNSPYQSKDITEFWRRWHMSLSFWLRDYLYISLGGNRFGAIRTHFNLLTTMLLGGLWHGAGWQFLIWGGLHGVALIFDKLFKGIFDMKRYKLTAIISGIITFHFVAFCWIYFRAENIDIAHNVMYQIAFNFNGQVAPQFFEGYKLVAVLMVLGYILHFIPLNAKQKIRTVVTQSPLVAKVAVVLAVSLVVIQLKSAEIQPFIYFQF